MGTSCKSKDYKLYSNRITKKSSKEKRGEIKLLLLLLHKNIFTIFNIE